MGNRAQHINQNENVQNTVHVAPTPRKISKGEQAARQRAHAARWQELRARKITAKMRHPKDNKPEAVQSIRLHQLLQNYM